MKTLARMLILLWACGSVSAGAAQHVTSPGPAPQPPSPPDRASPSSSQAQPVLVPVGFHHPAHGHVVVVNGGFWWGYPYPYPYYYGYPVAYYGEAYEKVGKEWGKQLKKGKVTVDQFINFLRLDLLRASDASRSHFQLGFIKGYGENALTLFTRALSQAREGLPAGSANAPPVRSNQSQIPTEAPAGGAPLAAPRYQ